MSNAQPNIPEAAGVLFEVSYGSDSASNDEPHARHRAVKPKEWDWSTCRPLPNPEGPNAALQILTTRQAQTAESPLSKSVIEQTAGSITDYEAVWQNKTGSVSSLQEPSRFLTQAPTDDWDFYSFAVSATRHDDDTSRRTFKSVLICSNPEISEMCSSLDYIPDSWKTTDLPIIVVPLALLRRQVQETSKRLSSLIRKVEEVEARVASKPVAIDFDDAVQQLHSCNTSLIKLERRWHFEDKLASSIQNFIDAYKQPKMRSQNIQFNACNFNTEGDIKFHIANEGQEEAAHGGDFQNDTYFRKLDSDSTLQGKLSRASEYDLSVLPRRISNQFTAIFNLIAQRDTNATIKIAEATLWDSSSMKTIAVMTLIFLPGTFICSFFSMSFFNWHAGPGESVTSSLWVYFAATVPFTTLVILTWVFCTRKRRKTRKSRKKVESGP